MIGKHPGKFTALLIQTILLFLLLAGSARALPGDVDPSFGFAGRSVVNLSQGQGEVLSLAVQPDGKIISAGLARDYTGAASRFLITRHNLNGSLDNTFGSGGIVTTTFANGSSSANAVALQSDGKIVVAGSAGDRFALARYNSDGSLDLTFGTSGLVAAQFLPSDTNYSLASSLAIQPDGKIVIAGDSFVRNPALASYVTDCNVGMARFISDGTLDPSFGTGGIVISDFGGFDRADVLAIQSDGKILIAGDSSTTATGPFIPYLFRHNSDGSADQTFGSSGLGAPIPGSFDVAALALQPDGKIVVSGTALSVSPANADFAVARLNSDGTLDSGFGVAGLAVADFVWTSGTRQNVASSLTLQTDGKILVGGYSEASFALLRYEANGSPDSGFGAGGLAIAQVSSLGTSTFNFAVAASSSFSVTSVTLVFGDHADLLPSQCFALPDGSIVASPFFLLPPGAVPISCGIPINSFLVEQPFALAIQTDGKIISGGVLNDKPVLVRYHAVATPKITVMNSGPGVGGIWSPDGAISCGTRCSAFYDSGNTVLLGWATALGTYFTGWSGCMPIEGGGCSLTLNGDAAVTAEFDLDISLDAAAATNLPPGAVGMNYVTQVGLPGMHQPLNSRVASGSVPSGLALNGRMLSGVPKKAGNFRFTVEFTDSTGAKSRRQLTLPVQKLLVLSTKSLKTGRAGRSYSLALKATGGDRAYTWSIIEGTLPTGFTLDGSSGRITGMPTSQGAYPLTVRVADGFGQRVERALSLIIN